MSNEVKVTGFIHANQPYGTDYIDGVWRKYDQTDVDAYNEGIAVAEITPGGYHKERALRDGLRMLEARMAAGMGVLVGKVVKCTPYRASFGRTHRDTTGNSVQLETVRETEIERGEKVSVAM